MIAEPAAHRAMIDTLRRQGARGPWLALLDALLRLAASEVQFLRHAERSWVSATFCGARHTFTLAFEGAAAVAAGEHLIAALPDHEFTLPGHLVADATITAAEHDQAHGPRLTITAELLVLDEA